MEENEQDKSNPKASNQIARKNSGDKEYIHYLSSQQRQERSLNVPVHTQENQSQLSQENRQVEMYNINTENVQQIFSYEKQHIMIGLDNIDFKVNNDHNKLNERREIKMKKITINNMDPDNHQKVVHSIQKNNRSEATSQQPPVRDKLKLKIDQISPKAQ